MKKQAVITLVIFLLVTASFSFGQNQPVRRPRLQANSTQDGLNLSVEQRQSLAKLRIEHQQARQVLMDQINLLNLENRQLMRDPEANAAKLKEMRRRIFELREQQFDQSLAHRKSRNAIFTPEQLEKVRALESRRDIRRNQGQRNFISRRGRSVRRGVGMRGQTIDRMRRDVRVNKRPTRIRRDMDW